MSRDILSREEEGEGRGRSRGRRGGGGEGEERKEGEEGEEEVVVEREGVMMENGRWRGSIVNINAEPPKNTSKLLVCVLH